MVEEEKKSMKGLFHISILPTIAPYLLPRFFTKLTAAYPDIDFSNGATLTRDAFAKIPVVGAPLLTFGLLTFAFSTILGWCYYGERAMEYLRGGRWVGAYRMVYITAIFLGSILNLTAVWNLADCMNALMAIPNLISLLLLNGVLVHETRKFLWRNRLEKEG